MNSNSKIDQLESFKSFQIIKALNLWPGQTVFYPRGFYQLLDGGLPGGLLPPRLALSGRGALRSWWARGWRGTAPGLHGALAALEATRGDSKQTGWDVQWGPWIWRDICFFHIFLGCVGVSSHIMEDYRLDKKDICWFCCGSWSWSCLIFSFCERSDCQMNFGGDVLMSSYGWQEELSNWPLWIIALFLLRLE